MYDCGKIRSNKLNSSQRFSDPERGAVALSSFHKLKEFQEPQWFCVHTKPAHENDAVVMLRKLSRKTVENVGELEIYFPRIRTQIAYRGKSRLVVRPLFPRYFFCKFLWAKAARFILSRPQIIRIVQFGALPTIVPEEIIKGLSMWSLENEGEVFDPTSALLTGQRVLIRSGPFKGMEANFAFHLSDRKRVALLLEYLQTHVRVIVDRSFVKPLA